MNRRGVVRLIRLFYLPILTYALFVGLRLFGVEPKSDLTGMHAVMGAVFLATGCTVCYLMSILPAWMEFRHVPRLRSRFWFLSALLFYLLLADAAFRIHEQMWETFKIPEILVFGTYGILLLGIVAVYRKTLHRAFWGFFAGFVLLSGTAVLGDATSAHEGTLTVGGRVVSYEQACETASVLLLAVAFTTEAIKDLVASVRMAGVPAREA